MNEIGEMTPKEFTAEEKEALREKVLGYMAQRVDYPVPKLLSAPILTRRTPIGKQREAIDALYSAYLRVGGGKLPQRGVFFLSGREGEGIGVGKTYVSIATAAALLHPQGRVLVLCPPHLVPKWCSEVEQDGLRAVEVKSVQDFLRLTKVPPTGVEFVLISKDRAKRLGERREALWKRAGGSYCPDCGTPLTPGKHTHCPACDTPLVAEGGKPTLGRLLLRHIHLFRFAILDEAHQYRNESQQSLLAARIAEKLPTLFLSGTLMGGYASELWRLLRIAEPGLLGGLSERSFVRQYGASTQVVRTFYLPNGKTKVRKEEKEAPGFAPTLVPLIVARSYFLGIKDLGQLPPYKERIHILPTTEPIQRYLGALREILLEMGGDENNRNKKEKPAYLGPLLMAAYLGMDVPGVRMVLTKDGPHPIRSPIPADLSPKERVLLSLVRLSRTQGEKVLIFTEGTGVWDVQVRLAEILADDGHRPFILTAEVPPEARYELLQRSPDVLIVNPRLVETGLDLVDYTVGIFYQVPLSAFTVRQAARRIYRLGQRKRVSLYYLAYEGVQESYLSWVAEKVRQSLLFEGSYHLPHATFIDDDPLRVLAEAFEGQIRRYRGDALLVGLGSSDQGSLTPPAVEEPSHSPVEAAGVSLPTLPEARVVRVRGKKILLEAGQPVLFL